MSGQEVPAEILEDIRGVERRARDAGDRVRQARDQMRECAGDFEQLHQRVQEEPWYTGGFLEEAERLRSVVSELGVLVLDLEERGW